MVDDHDEHVAVHLEILKGMQDTLVRVRHAPGFFKNLWLTLRHGPRFITLREHWAEAYKAMEQHIPNHLRLIKKNERRQL